jgi:hypothetical protein
MAMAMAKLGISDSDYRAFWLEPNVDMRGTLQTRLLNRLGEATR